MRKSRSLCADPSGGLGGYYVCRDEPSIEFKSKLPGSGNDVTYVMTLPKDPAVEPNASGAGGTTWNFELRPTFWFGMTMCDTESAPEFTKACTPDSDANDLTGTNPRAANYIGKHPGNAYMELQFCGPGYVEQFEGFGCTATQYCAAMTIDSRTLDQNHGAAATNGTENTKACNPYILGGPEPINWAYVTRSAFHPECSTANTRGNTWSAHTYNVAMSDEIGHFENCLAIDENFNCTHPGSQDAGVIDEDDLNSFCVPGTDSTLVKIEGCFSADEDWGSQAYQPDWPGTIRSPFVDSAVHPTPLHFTSPLTVRGRNYSTIAFETDLPALEFPAPNFTTVNPVRAAATDSIPVKSVRGSPTLRFTRAIR